MLARMVVAIVGSRDFGDRALVRRTVAALREEFGDTLEVISGGSPGADTLAIEAAMLLGVRDREIRPDDRSWGDRAHSVRNHQLVEAADLVVAFFSADERSPGTSETLAMARVKGIPTRVFHRERWSDR